jgi:hypothetical protein
MKESWKIEKIDHPLGFANAAQYRVYYDVRPPQTTDEWIRRMAGRNLWPLVFKDGDVVLDLVAEVPDGPTLRTKSNELNEAFGVEIKRIAGVAKIAQMVSVDPATVGQLTTALSRTEEKVESLKVGGSDNREEIDNLWANSRQDDATITALAKRLEAMDAQLFDLGEESKLHAQALDAHTERLNAGDPEIRGILSALLTSVRIDRVAEDLEEYRRQQNTVIPRHYHKPWWRRLGWR